MGHVWANKQPVTMGMGFHVQKALRRMALLRHVITVNHSMSAEEKNQLHTELYLAHGRLIHSNITMELLDIELRHIDELCRRVENFLITEALGDEVKL